MRIRKYGFDYGRRALLEKSLKGAVAAGVLGQLWPGIGEAADVSKVYPDELTSVDMYTKGKIKTGDYITADNVEAVKELLDPIVYLQIKNLGRKIKIRATTKDVTTMFPASFLEASLKNRGKAKFGEDGNVYTQDGKPWMGGAPFLDPKTAQEAIANLALSWGKHDYCQYAIRETDISPEGRVAYQYDFCWAELQATNRMDGKIFQDKKEFMRWQTVLFTASPDVAGSSFLSTWYYDQRKYPDLYGYLPQFKRVRQFPTNQRFEPLVPGVTWFLTDPWYVGDPMLTWGNFKVISRKPMLGAWSGNWQGKNKNWEKTVHGGPKGITFMDVEYELAPEVLEVEMEPIGYPRAPCSRKRAWIDARNGMYCGEVRYDRNGQPWVNFETGSGQMVDGDKVVLEKGRNTPDWSWTFVQCHDIQGNRNSRADHVEQVTGGYKSQLHGDSEEMYSTFFTQQAIQRLGQV